MDDRVRQYIQAYQADVVIAAEARLGRSLTANEKAGIENLYSGLRLEGLYMAFSHASTSQAEVAETLAQLAKPTPPQAATLPIREGEEQAQD